MHIVILFFKVWVLLKVSTEREETLTQVADSQLSTHAVPGGPFSSRSNILGSGGEVRISNLLII